MLSATCTAEPFTTLTARIAWKDNRGNFGIVYNSTRAIASRTKGSANQLADPEKRWRGKERTIGRVESSLETRYLALLNPVGSTRDRRSTAG